LDADLVDFDQCSAGAESKKPTCLMAVNLPQLRPVLRSLPGQGFCAHGRKGHKAVLKGLAEDGTWRTAPAKQYPSGMCNAVSDAVLEFILSAVNHTMPGERQDLPPNVSPFYTPLDPYCAEHTLGAYGQDFHASKAASSKSRYRGRPTQKPWLLPKNATVSTDRTTAPVPVANNPVPTSSDNEHSLAYLSLTDAQIDRIAVNRARAIEIRRTKRLDWLRAFSEVSHVPSSPDHHIDPVVRTLQSIRSGSTLRNRFVFGRTRPKDALAAMYSNGGAAASSASLQPFELQ